MMQIFLILLAIFGATMVWGATGAGYMALFIAAAYTFLYIMAHA